MYSGFPGILWGWCVRVCAVQEQREPMGIPLLKNAIARNRQAERVQAKARRDLGPGVGGEQAHDPCTNAVTVPGLWQVLMDTGRQPFLRRFIYVKCCFAATGAEERIWDGALSTSTPRACTGLVRFVAAAFSSSCTPGASGTLFPEDRNVAAGTGACGAGPQGPPSVLHCEWMGGGEWWGSGVGWACIWELWLSQAHAREPL